MKSLGIAEARSRRGSYAAGLRAAFDGCPVGPTVARGRLR